MKGFTTKAIHGSRPNDDIHRALRPPVYDCAAFEFESAEDIESAFLGRKLAHSYGRISNPTVSEFEFRAVNLFEAQGAVALASGMAAITSTLLALMKTGESIIAPRHLFGNTYSLLNKTLRDWGLDTRFVDMEKPENVEDAIDESTRIIFAESISNPQMSVVDLEAIGEIARKHGIVFVLDNTLTTPYLLKSRDFGVHVDVISSTKYISGGATAIGGLILDYGTFHWGRIEKLKEEVKKFGNFAFLNKLRKEVFRNTGACMAPQTAYLHTLGLETLSLRIQKSTENALAIAGFLAGRKEVLRVNYPGVTGYPQAALAKKLMPGGCGGLLTFNLKDKPACFRFMNQLKIIRRATNLNDNKTLIIHPASTIYS